MIVCRTLGPVQVSLEDGSTPVELQWSKHLGLIVYLARSPRKTRTREHLIGLLWGDKPEAKARRSLNTAVSLLRRYAGAAAVKSDSTQISLRGGGVRLDTEELDGCVAARGFAAGVALIGGEFLEGFSIPGASQFDDWMTAEREHWRRRSVEVLLCRADELGATGDITGALEQAERALALDPESETALRALMRGLALTGDRPGALKRYDAFAARLKREVGTELTAETQGLAQRVRLERTWRLPERAGSAGVGKRAPLVGRGRELARLVEAWTACREQRHPAFTVIEGDAGTGKTRLAEEFVARARLDGATVAAVRAVEADREDAWSGVLGLARGGLVEAPGALAAPPSVLAELRNAAPGPALGRAFSQVLEAVADEQPLVVWVDDAQWLDRESLLALGRAARDLPRSRVLLVCTAMPHPARVELNELRARIGRELAGAAVQIGALSTDAVRTLARWAVPSYDGVQLDRLTRRVTTDSAGIPLLVVALLEAVAAGLDLRHVPGAWPEPLRTLDQTPPGELPDAVVAAIRVLFSNLSGDAQRVLVAAAVLGLRVPAPVLGRASGLAADSLAVALDELEWQRLLSSEPRGYAFVARIVRDVIDRDMVAAGQRERIREAAGAAAPPG